jgi:hypothetical protein
MRSTDEHGRKIYEAVPVVLFDAAAGKQTSQHSTRTQHCVIPNIHGLMIYSVLQK